MDQARLIADLKKHWLWAVLALTLLVSALVGPENETDQGIEPPASNKSPAQSKERSSVMVPSASAQVTENWPLRKVQHDLVRDIFQSPQVAAEAAKLAQESAAKSEQELPSTPQEQFAMVYFGHINDGLRQTVFFSSPDKSVKAVEIGQNINSDWKLMTLESKAMTLRHLPTGQTFQYPLDPAP